MWTKPSSGRALLSRQRSRKRSICLQSGGTLCSLSLSLSLTNIKETHTNRNKHAKDKQGKNKQNIKNKKCPNRANTVKKILKKQTTEFIFCWLITPGHRSLPQSVGNMPSETPLEETNFFLCKWLSFGDSFLVGMDVCLHFLS